MRRILFIILGIVLIAALAAGIYFLFFGKTAPTISVDPGSLFGTNEAPSGATLAPELGIPTNGAGENVAPRLVRITEEPVAYGAIAFATTTQINLIEGTTTRTSMVPDTEIRYVERASGNIYAYTLGERTLTRLTNKTLPGIQEAAWTGDGSRAFLRFISGESASTEHIESYSLPAAGGEVGYLLERDLSAVETIGTSTLVTLKESTDGSVATTAKADGTGAKTLFSSTLSALRIKLYTSGFALFTRASANMNGYGFMSEGTSGNSVRVLGPLPGLTLLPSPSGKQVLYSYVTNGSTRLAVLDVATRTSTPLPVATLAEKCVWSSDATSVYCAVPRALSGTLPDDWYQGAVSFSDRMWEIDMAARVANLVVDPKTSGAIDVDAIALTIDPKGDVLVFTNKKDGALFVYDL